MGCVNKFRHIDHKKDQENTTKNKRAKHKENNEEDKE